MFLAMAPAAPRKGCSSSPAEGSTACAGGMRGTVCRPLAGAAGAAGAEGVDGAATLVTGFVVPLVSGDLGAPLESKRCFHSSSIDVRSWWYCSRSASWSQLFTSSCGAVLAAMWWGDSPDNYNLSRIDAAWVVPR